MSTKMYIVPAILLGIMILFGLLIQNPPEVWIQRIWGSRIKSKPKS